MPQSQQKFNVGLTLDVDGFYLTDRWGEIGENDNTDTYLAEIGVSRTDISEAVKAHQHCFGDEICFLAWCAPQPGQPRCLNLIIEFEYSDEWLPDLDLESSTSDEEKAAWRKTLAFHSPSLLHTAKGLAALPGAAGKDLLCYFDFSAIYGGSMGVVLPFELSAHYEAIKKLLFQNGLPFPHSNHAQIDAMSQISWVFPQNGFPTDILNDPAQHTTDDANISTPDKCDIQ